MKHFPFWCGLSLLLVDRYMVVTLTVKVHTDYTGSNQKMSATVLLVVLACLLIAAKCAGWICHHLHLPAVLGQLLVGVVVGPPLLGWVQVNGTLSSFAILGVFILLFIAAIYTYMHQMHRVEG